MRIKRDRDNEYGNNKLNELVIRRSEKILNTMYESVHINNGYDSGRECIVDSKLINSLKAS